MSLQNYIFGHLNDYFERVKTDKPFAEFLDKFLVEIEASFLNLNLKVIIADKLKHFDVNGKLH